MPRKTLEGRKQEAKDDEASMRPRPDAAENVDLGHEPRRATLPASMRPRPDAAENLIVAAALATACSTLQ